MPLGALGFARVCRREAATPTIPATTSTIAPMAAPMMMVPTTRADKATAGYRFADDMGSRCAVCAYYQPGYSEGQGECALVAGPIRADAMCDMMMPAPAPVVLKGYEVVKSDDSEHLVFGWAYLSVRKDGSEVVDHSGETIDIDELEKAAYEFALTSRESGEDHDGGPISGELVESFVVTDEKLSAMTCNPESGEADDEAFEAVRKNLPRGYWLGFHIADDNAYERAKSSKTAFSIEGSAVRTPVN